MDQDSTFGEIVKEHRHYLDLTQAELARRVACATITIRKIEYDSLRPSIQIAERLATSLKIPLEERTAFVRLARTSLLTTPTPSPIPTPPPTPEEIGLEDLSGRAIRGYELSERMGEGGFGVVYRAIQPLVEREVAVKIVLPRYANHPDFIRRFEAEAQLVARLEHPHIVPLYDYWREPGAAFLVMRLMRGGSLHSRLKAGPLSLEFILHLLSQVGEALYAAHRMGVIHRDLKPANILLDEDENTYLADFGVAKDLSNPEQPDNALLSAVSGSPAYTSPEQIRAEPVRPQADIYALGVLLFELLTGRQPFPGPTPIDYAQQHLSQPLPPLLEYNPNLPATLEPVLIRATAKSTEMRYPDLPSLVSDFEFAVLASGIQLPASVTFDWLPAVQGEIQTFENPYKGLRPFEEADAENFFGRETLVQDLLGRMAEENDLSRFLAVVGPSGSGKSSAVKAGLIPSLRRGGLPGSEQWFFTGFTPGSHPFEELETALLRVAVNPPESLLGQLQEDEHGLLRSLEHVLPTDQSIELVLVIDQFEELFTLVESEDIRAAFLESLVTALLDPRSRLRVVITLRADFTDRPLEYVDFGELLRQRAEFVLPLAPDELQLAIQQPAHQAGLALEAGLCERIIHDLGDQPGTLPLLQYTLSELFERRVGRSLTLQAYQDSGGVLGALGKRAEEIFTSLDPDAQETTRQVFLRLVTLGEGVEDTRRRVLQSELKSLSPDQHPQISHIPEDAPGRRSAKSGIKEILDTFGRARLLSFDRDPLTRGPTVEVAHEALLREWPRFREWLNSSRIDIRNQRILGSASAEWLQASRDPSFLLRGARLDQFASWAESTDLTLTQDEAEYLQECLTERRVREAAEAERIAHEAALERRSHNFLRALVAVLAVATLVALVLTIFAFNQQGEAQNSAATAQAEALARGTQQAVAESETDLRATQQAVAETERDARAVAEQQALEDRDQAVEARQDALVQAAIGVASQAELQAEGRSPETAVLLALEALENYPYTWQAEKALGNAILKSRLRKVIPFDNDTYQTLDWSSDGSQILISGMDWINVQEWGNANVRVLDVSTGEEILRITDGEPNMASWSPDERSILTLIEKDIIVNVLDADSGSILLTLDKEDIGGDLNTIITDWEPWSPSGDRFLIYTTDGAVRIFDALTGDILQTLTGHVGELVGDQKRRVELAVWSPFGDLIAASSIAGNNVIVYQADTGKALYSIPGGFETEGVVFGDWSSSGDRFITRGMGGAKVYETATGKKLLDLSTPQTYCYRALWSPDDSYVWTFDDYLSETIWDAEEGQVLHRIENIPAILTGDLSPSGDLFLVHGADGLVQVFDARTGQLIHKMSGTFAWSWMVKFSPDGERIVAVGEDNTINVFDLTESQLYTPVLTCEWITGPGWSPDGRQVAFGSNCPPDSLVKILDSSSGEQLAELPGNKEQIYGVQWSPSGDRILTTYEDGSAQIWDAHNFEPHLTITGPGVEHTLAGEAWSPDGSRIEIPYWDGTVVIYDSSNGKPILTFSGHTRGGIQSVYWSPDGTRLISSTGQGEVLIWDAITGEVLLDLSPEDFNLEVSYAGWTNDGERVILLTEDGFVHIIDSSSEETIFKFFIRAASSNATISMSPTEDRMIIGGYENAASVWDIATGTEIITYEVGGPVVPAYSPDGKRIMLVNLAGGDWGGVYIFPVWDSLEELVAYAKECCVIRELTADEREVFGLPPLQD